MDNKFLDESINYYRDKIKQFGSSAEGMDWKNSDTQYLRFEVISRYIDFSTRPSVLDVGCGNGEFNNYIRQSSKAIVYSGIDAVPEMVSLTNERFGADTASLQDLLSWDTEKRFDYVIASGTFNAKLSATDEEWQEYFYGNIKKMFSMANKAVIFNCMTSFVDYRYDRLYYPTVQELSDFAVKNLSRKFIIDHSYPLYEVTMVIQK